jgi:cation transport regulator ChaB
MLKRTITYTDYNGVERTEDFYFNLTQAEISEMELSHDGGLTAMIDRIVKAKDQSQIIKVFKTLLLSAYGQKSEDGRRFIKNDAVREEFAQTEAYSIIFMELATDDQKADEFIKGIMPKTAVKPALQVSQSN